MGIVKINIQCNKLEITSVAQKKLLLLVCVVWNRPCICRRGTAVVWSRELFVYSFRVVLELCVIDEEGCVCLSVCFLVSCVCVWFSLEFGSVTARTSTTANFCLPNTQHVHALKHTVWISHEALVQQVASLAHPTDQPFTSVRCVSKGPHTSRKNLLSSVCVLRLWLKFMPLWWRLESFSLQGLQLPYKLEGANLFPVHFRVSLLSRFR